MSLNVVFWTSFVWIFLVAIGSVIFYLYVILSRKKYPFDVCLRIRTGGGKPTIDLAKGRLHKSKDWGDWILLKGKNRRPIPMFDQEAFLPEKRGGRHFLDLTSMDGYYYANNFESLTRRLMRKPIVLVNEHGDSVEVKNKEELHNFLKDKYRYVDYNSVGGMVNPVPYVNRAQAMQNDKLYRHIYAEKTAFWKSPQFIFISALTISAILVIVILILTFQNAADLAGTATPTRTIVDAAAGYINSSGKPPTP